MSPATTHTQYAGNYVYLGNTEHDMKLQFIQHPEGYITPIVITGAGGPKEVKGNPRRGPTFSHFQYVFQYKDHLGNVRLSYTDADLNGAIDPTSEIIEESNYYPFGPKQKGYNKVITGNGNALAQQWKFQGQELTEDLGLNFHEWKYRISDPTIGRFWQVDPLAEKFAHNGIYNFSENRVIDAIELEGKEAYLIHGTLLPGTNYTNSGYWGDNLVNQIKSDFGSKNYGEWNGEWSSYSRKASGFMIGKQIIDTYKPGSPLLILGHSHGGNVAIEAAEYVVSQFKGMLDSGKISNMPEINLVLLNTPVITDLIDGHNPSKLLKEFINFIQVDSNFDLVSGVESTSEFYDGAVQIEYSDQIKSGPCSYSNHCGQSDVNAKIWYPKVQMIIEYTRAIKLELLNNIFRDINRDLNYNTTFKGSLIQNFFDGGGGRPDWAPQDTSGARGYH